MEILCPFCFKEHSGNKCTQEGKEGVKKIPASYIKKVSKGMPVYPIVVIGYSGCGKTTFLCSLIYSLFESHFFHIEPLDQDTINTVKVDYYPQIVNKKSFLSLTQVRPTTLFEEPLLLELHINQKKQSFAKNKELILLMYDVSGERYSADDSNTKKSKGIDSIANNLPFIAQIPNLILLIDLYSMYIKHQDKVEIELQGLVSTVKRALDELDSSPRKKNAIICFTKSDECWGKEGFGPLAKREALSENFEEYCKNMADKSNAIEEFLKNSKRYDDFYRSIVKDFGGWFFIDTSSVGGKVNHETNTFDTFSPYRVIDPILWLLNH